MSQLTDYRLVVLGSGGVGKSCLTVQFISDKFLTGYDPTIEESYRKQVDVDGRVVMLDLLDTAGQDEFSAMRDTYMRTGQGFVLVYSITDASSVDDVVNLYEQLCRNKDTDEVPIVLVGNKCDLETERAVTHEEGSKLAERFGEYCTFVEASAKERINVDEIFKSIVRNINAMRNPAERGTAAKEQLAKSSPAAASKEQKAGKRKGSGSKTGGLFGSMCAAKDAEQDVDALAKF